MSNCTVRAAISSDMDEVMAMIQKLADFEKMPDGPKITSEVLKKDCFESSPPLFKCAIAEVASEENVKIVAYALFFNVYSTWEGKSMMLEDIYVRPEFRKMGIGKMIFNFVVERAYESSCCRVDFHVLSWNPAISFYKKAGAYNLTETENWHYFRLDKESMAKIVNKNGK